MASRETQQRSSLRMLSRIRIIFLDFRFMYRIDDMMY
ncbi:hypothetical protein M6B38_300795 [Iris pallida]|uniref:Uncharacterized protein n=1 Tax=Iris pallida TaxID=29817 RepID=A0AAX6F0K0_IRIPA|nr:hypothetical protein M6B38_159745 [Iris pallida]KAJ6843211.1 hypothetical protein M6B38_300795 [Iris pallida]